jgi:hypothetical protein
MAVYRMAVLCAEKGIAATQEGVELLRRCTGVLDAHGEG